MGARLDSERCPASVPLRAVRIRVLARQGETIEGSRTMRNRPYPVLKCSRKKEKTDNPREGGEDGTPPPHRDFKERGVVR